MGPGGKRAGAGRPKGSRNRATRERAAATQAAADVIKAVTPGAFEGDAHALLMAVYKDPRHEMALRIDAAKAAIKFEKPALSSVEAKVAMTMEDLTDDQLNEIILRDGSAIGLLAH